MCNILGITSSFRGNCLSYCYQTTNLSILFSMFCHTVGRISICFDKTNSDNPELGNIVAHYEMPSIGSFRSGQKYKNKLIVT